MHNLRYHWDPTREVYYYKTLQTKRRIYNYDDLAEYLYGEDQENDDGPEDISEVPQGDIPMADANHEEDTTWLNVIVA